MSILKNKLKSLIPNTVLFLAFLLKLISDKMSIVGIRLHMLFKTELGKAAIEAEKGMKALVEKMKAQYEEQMKKQQEAVKNSQNVFVLDPSKKQKD